MAKAASKRAWGPTIPNPEEQFELKRQVVLDVAAKTFGRRGYDHTTLTDIATELNIAKPTLYYYFKSKDEILYEIQKAAISSVIDFAPGSPDNPKDPDLSIEERLARFIRRYTRMITSDYGACLSTAPTQALKPGTQARLASSSRYVDQILRDILADGVAEGVFRPCDPKLSAGLLFGSLNWIPHWRHHDGGPSADEISQALTELTLRGLMTGSDFSPPGRTATGGRAAPRVSKKAVP